MFLKDLVVRSNPALISKQTEIRVKCLFISEIDKQSLRISIGIQEAGG